MEAEKEMYLIWSNEHEAWWRPAGMGYVRDRRKAGKYHLEQALHICHQANMFTTVEQMPNAAIVPYDPEWKGEK